MKTMSKKLASIVLALCLCFSLVGTALAATSSDEGTTFSITVTNAADGETYSAYKIFDVTYSYDGEDKEDGNYSYTIDSTSAWWGVVEAASNLQDEPVEPDEGNSVIFNLTRIGTSTTYIVTVDEDVTGEQIAAALTPVPEGAKAAATTTASGGTAVLNVTNVEEGGGPGYYYVTTSLGSLVMIDTTNPTPTIEEKNEEPTLDKTVNHVKDESDENNSIVEFEIDIDHITGVKNLILHDELPNEESLITDDENFPITVTLMKHVYNETTGDEEEPEVVKVMVEGTDYDIAIITETNPCAKGDDNCSFEINFSDFDFSDCTEDYYIEIVYDVAVDTSSDEYSGDYETLVNDAFLTYGNASYSTRSEAEVDLFGFEINKYSNDVENLAGAIFNIKDSTGATAYFDYDATNGIYILEGWGTAPEESEYITDLVSTSTGNIRVEGFETGIYTLTEIAAPDGYNMLTYDITVTITETLDNTEEHYSSFTVTYTDENKNSVTAKDAVVPVLNNTGSILPGTGGMGTTIFYIIGGVLVAGAVVVLITRRRMSSNEG